MRVVNTSNVKWHQNKLHIRAGGGLKIKQILRGQTGAPENYLFNMSHSAGDYGSPRHRHNFDQVRFVLDGNMRISPNQVVREGQIGYFPEGTTYGPYNDAGKKRTIMIVQFGGASGYGYMAADQAVVAKKSLLAEGNFEDGYFHRTTGKGPRRTDAYRAVWERCFGRRMDLPKPRYEKPVIVDPKNFGWQPTGDRGITRKSLGIFTERQTRLEMVRIEAGCQWISPSEQSVSLFFALDGAGVAGGKKIGRYSAAETEAGERMKIESTKDLTVFSLVMPLIQTVTLEQAA
jgi:hypothetical protein